MKYKIDDKYKFEEGVIKTKGLVINVKDIQSVGEIKPTFLSNIGTAIAFVLMFICMAISMLLLVPNKSIGWVLLVSVIFLYIYAALKSPRPSTNASSDKENLSSSLMMTMPNTRYIFIALLLLYIYISFNLISDELGIAFLVCSFVPLSLALEIGEGASANYMNIYSNGNIIKIYTANKKTTKKLYEMRSDIAGSL